MRIAIVAGGLLGILSRVEESMSGVSLGVSSDATWLAVAFLVGAAARGRPAPRAAASGALTLTAANAAYYAWIAATEPGTDLAAVAGSPVVWFVLGVSSGGLFGLAGHVWTATRGAPRVVAAALLGGVFIAEGIPALLGGSSTDGVGLAVGAALPVASAGTPAGRGIAAALAAALIAVALTGRLEALLP